MAVTNKDFAARMREKRSARERETKLSSGAADAAWQKSYRLIYQQFGKPDSEMRDDENQSYFMSWNGGGDHPLVVFDLGVVYRALRLATRRLAVLEMVRQHETWISAKATEYSFVVSVPPADFPDFAPIERWSIDQNLPPVKVLNDPKTLDHVLLFVRSNGPLDWFGREVSKRPVVVVEIP